MDAVTLLTTTRTVRRKLDLDRPLPDEVITDSLRIAQQAPAAGEMLGAMRWVIVRDPALRAKIAPLVRSGAAPFLEPYAHIKGNKTLDSARHLLAHLERVPVLAIPCLPGRPPEGLAEQTGYYGSIYPAIWSFQLALRTHGAGSSMCAYHLAAGETDVAALLGIPNDITQITMLAVAYTTQNDFSPAARPPVEEIVHVDRWGT